MCCISFTGKIRRGFSALEVYNYFEAKRLFEKEESKHIVAASYGLSIIYQREDNPFSNIDSAYVKIVRAVDHFSDVKPGLREKYAQFGVDSISIMAQRDLISAIMYANAVAENSVAAYQGFIDRHPWSDKKKDAIYKRDSLAFEIAITTSRSAGYEQFLRTYPNSVFSQEAKSSYDRLLYVENTQTDNFVDYLNFLEKYPDSPYRPDAEDKIYEIATRNGTRDSYEKFIQDFPSNHNVKNAWKKLFNVHLQDEYSLNSLQNFKNSFPDYPYSKELEQQLEIAEVKLYPLSKDGKWGFLSKDNTYKIDFIYDEVEEFSEGLAVVKMNEKYGYINKLGDLVIPPGFDDALSFNEGHAVVGVNEKWGMINRNGEFTVEPRYEDLGNLESGLAYFQEGELYGYFDEKGLVRLQPQFTDAYDFKDGRAIVSYNDYYGVIDLFGTTYVPYKYEDVAAYGVGVYKARLRSNWGIINEKGDTIVPFIYDYIGEMHDNRALVERGGEFNFITQKGKLILDKWIPDYSEFRQLARFRNGYAKINYEDGYNLVDTTGKRLFPRNQLDVGQFGELIAVKKGKTWGYLTKTGSVAIPNTFSLARSFEGKYALAGAEPLWGVIDKKGKYLIEPYFEQLSFLNDSLIVAKSRGSYGILTIDADTLLNFSYISVEPIEDSIVELMQGNDLFYYDLKRNRFIRKEE